MRNKITIFHPLILPVAFLIFLTMGYIGSFNYRFTDPLNINVIITVILACVVFTAGVLITRADFKDKKIDFLSEKVLLILLAAGLLLQSLNLVLLGGIPLFSSTLKSSATTNLWRIAYPLVLITLNLLLAKFYHKKYILLIILCGVIFTLNGYRTSVLGILGSSFITLYLKNKISNKVSLILIILITSLILIVGYIASQSIATQHWTLNPLELVFYRAAFTLEVLEKIIPLNGTTHGHILSMIFSSGSPRTFIGNYVLHYNVCITSTLIGPILLDFGYIGLIIQMFFMGVFLKLMYETKNIALYSIILTHSLIWIETGSTDIMIWFLYLIGLIYLIQISR